VKRIDSKPLLVGQGKYFDDFGFQGYHAVIVRSPYAHARILGIDSSRAESLGARVLTGRMMKIRTQSQDGSGTDDAAREGGELTSFLAVDKVRYQGEPVAVVVADETSKTADLAEMVDVEYEPMEPFLTIEKAISNTNSTPIFAEFPKNIVLNQTFNFGTLPPENSLHLDLELNWGRSLANPIEPFGVTALPEEGGVTIYVGTQGARFIAEQATKTLGFKVRLVPTRMGGSFGSKFSIMKYVLILSFAARYFNVPIKWTETRREHFLASGTSGPERKFKVRTYFTSSGEVLGYDCEVWEDVGATKEGSQALKPLAMLAGPYKFQNIRDIVNNVATNKNPSGAFRGAGTPPHAWFVERLMDAVADNLKMDRVDVRMKNLVDQFPWQAPGAYYDSGNPKSLLKAALDRKDIFSMRSNDVGVGISIATDCSTPASSSFNPGEGVKIHVGAGRVTLGIGYAPQGQGNEHVELVLASKLLGVPVEAINIQTLDTASSVTSFGPGGSRMAAYAAGAVSGAVEELKKKLREKAVLQLGTTNVDYSVIDGSFIADGRKLKLLDMEGEAEFVFSMAGKTRYMAYPFCCNLSAVRVDEAGKIIPLKQVVFIDPGTPLDEEIVKEQLQGGTATGIALALYERMEYDDSGNMVSATFGDYGLPSAIDLPDIEVNVVPSPSPFTPMGVKGIGEIPVGVACAAVTSAVEDVMKKRITSIPMDYQKKS